MKYNKFILFFISALIMSIASTNLNYSQTMVQAFESMATDILEPYASPATNPLGANLNSAWLNRVPAKEIAGFSFSFGLYGMLSPIEKGAETFSSSRTFFLSETQARDIVVDQVSEMKIHQQIIDQLVNIPFNIFADGGTINGEEVADLTINLAAAEDLVFEVNHPDVPFPVSIEIEEAESINIDLEGYLVGLEYLPSATPQFNFGTIYGTEAVVRFVPAIEVNEDIGSVGMFGFGLLHNPKVWFDYDIPVDFSVGFFTQKIDLGNRGEISSFSAGLHVRKNFDFGWIGLTPFASFSTESAKFDLQETRTFNTNFGEQTVNIKLKMDAENSARATIGNVIELAFVNLTLSYNIAKHSTIVGGMTFNFDFFN